MKNFKLSEILKPVIVLTAICLVTSALLAYTNKITAPEIEKQNALAANEARSTVLSEAKDFESAKLNGNEEYFIGKSESGDVIGYVFTTTAKSYGGEIQVMVGIKTDGSVNAVELLQINDTPGLGMNAKNPEFLKQFENKTAGIGVNKNTPAENEIQALTGATITSSAVTDAVNAALENYANVTGGADNG